MDPNPRGATPDPGRRPVVPHADGIIPEFSLGDRLRKAREIAGFDQIALAAAIDVHRQTVARYENGAASPRRPVLLSWALTTGVSLDWLSSGETGNSTHDGTSTRTTDSLYCAD